MQAGAATSPLPLRIGPARARPCWPSTRPSIHPSIYLELTSNHAFISVHCTRTRVFFVRPRSIHPPTDPPIGFSGRDAYRGMAMANGMRAYAAGLQGVEIRVQSFYVFQYSSTGGVVRDMRMPRAPWHVPRRKDRTRVSSSSVTFAHSRSIFSGDLGT